MAYVSIQVSLESVHFCPEQMSHFYSFPVWLPDKTFFETDPVPFTCSRESVLMFLVKSSPGEEWHLLLQRKIVLWGKNETKRVLAETIMEGTMAAGCLRTLEIDGEELDPCAPALVPQLTHSLSLCHYEDLAWCSAWFWVKLFTW